MAPVGVAYHTNRGAARVCADLSVTPGATGGGLRVVGLAGNPVRPRHLIGDLLALPPVQPSDLSSWRRSTPRGRPRSAGS